MMIAALFIALALVATLGLAQNLGTPTDAEVPTTAIVNDAQITNFLLCTDQDGNNVELTVEGDLLKLQAGLTCLATLDLARGVEPVLKLALSSDLNYDLHVMASEVDGHSEL